jgi:alkylation response protein AidB-like acyl-CoA dehydrogenase
MPKARMVDECVQILGGSGGKNEPPVACIWVDSRLERTCGGVNKIMREETESSR